MMRAGSLASPVGRRFDALDTLRCLAVLFMVQGHAFTLTIENGVRGELWYRWHNYLHGFTAPAFLFGAGLAFGVTTLHSIEAHASWGPTLRRRLFRYGSLLAIGYALQLPGLPRDGAALSHAQLLNFVRVEALQHIGVAMLVCQGLVVALRERRRVALAALALGVTTVLLGPWLSRASLDGVPLALAAFLSTKAGSTFPLVPWVGFLFAGVAVAGLLPKPAMFEPSRTLCVGLPLAGLALVGISLALDSVAPDAFGDHAYWKASPYFFARRLGWLAVLLGAFAIADRALGAGERRGGSARLWVQRISQSSLVVYVAHLLILYGSPINRGVNAYATRALSPLQGAALVALMFGALALLLIVWERLEANWSEPFGRVRRTAVATVAASVLVCAGYAAVVAPRAGAPVDAHAPTSFTATLAPAPETLTP